VVAHQLNPSTLCFNWFEDIRRKKKEKRRRRKKKKKKEEERSRQKKEERFFPLDGLPFPTRRNQPWRRLKA